MSQIELITQVIPASGRIDLATNNFFFMLSATGSINVRIQSPSGYSEGVNGVSAGLKIQRVNAWQSMAMLGAVGVSVTYFIGTTTVREDTTDIQSQIAVLGGISAISEAPSNTIATPANVAAATGASTPVVANLTRRRITVGSLSTNTGSVFIQAAGTAVASRGIELQAGQFVELMTTAAFDIRNDTGAVQTITFFEET